MPLLRHMASNEQTINRRVNGEEGMTKKYTKGVGDKNDVWKGIGKLIEEAGEVSQVLGKLIPFPDGRHPDGNGNLRQRIQEEIADLYAALDYFVGENSLNGKDINARRQDKYRQFMEWGLTGLPNPYEYSGDGEKK